MIAKVPYPLGAFPRPPIGSQLLLEDDFVEVIGYGPDYILVRLPGVLRTPEMEAPRALGPILRGRIDLKKP